MARPRIKPVKPIRRRKSEPELIVLDERYDYIGVLGQNMLPSKFKTPVEAQEAVERALRASDSWENNPALLVAKIIATGKPLTGIAWEGNKA